MYIRTSFSARAVVAWKHKSYVSIRVEVLIWCLSCHIRMYGPFAPFSSHSRYLPVIKIELFAGLTAQLHFPSDIGRTELSWSEASASDSLSSSQLEINECGIVVLISGLLSCTFLQYLEIGNCANLKSILDLGEKFHSLTQLEIWKCLNLKLTPNLWELRSLTQLVIWECHNLIAIEDQGASHSLAR